MAYSLPEVRETTLSFARASHRGVAEGRGTSHALRFSLASPCTSIKFFTAGDKLRAAVWVPEVEEGGLYVEFYLSQMDHSSSNRQNPPLYVE